MAANDFEVLKISEYLYKNSLSTLSPDAKSNNCRKVFQGPDKNIYTISGNEQVTVPGAVGIAWRAADADLVLISRA